jgi:2-polyprenyl-6-methoxyphenol hydroxylase-like FAD-dependent oxidoreductase
MQRGVQPINVPPFSGARVDSFHWLLPGTIKECQSMNHEYEVLVVGAGPVGLLLSLDLARRGIRVGVIEKNETPMSGSKGKGIQPRTQEILEQLGLLDAFEAVGGTYPTIRLYKQGQIKEEPYAARIEPTPDRPYPNIMMVPQATTEEILRKQLQALGVDVQWGHELIGLEQDASKVTATVASTQKITTLTARYLVGADGGRSFARHALGIGFAGETLPRRAIFADVRIDGLSTDVWHRWPEAPGGQMSLCPLLGTNLFQMAAEVPPVGDIELSESAVADVVKARLGREDIQVTEVPWRSVLRVSLRLADRYRVGRIFLTGDAAHIHPPTGAQGLNTGVQDAYNLGWKLALALRGGDVALLDSYEAERRPVAEDMLALSGALLNAWQDQQKTRRGALTSQLELAYRDAAYAVEMRSRPGEVRAGDRAPDAPCRDARQHPARIFDLLRHPGFTLLGYKIGADQLALVTEGMPVRAYAIDVPGAAIKDDQGYIRKYYDLQEPAFILIRPDGYIGAWADASCAHELRDLMCTWLGETTLAAAHG